MLLIFGSRLQTLIFEIEAADTSWGIFSDGLTKACPIKLPTFAGTLPEDFLTFRNKFERAASDNNYLFRSIGKLRECLQRKALSNPPTSTMHGPTLR